MNVCIWLPVVTLERWRSHHSISCRSESYAAPHLTAVYVTDTGLLVMKSVMCEKWEIYEKFNVHRSGNLLKYAFAKTYQNWARFDKIVMNICWCSCLSHMAQLWLKLLHMWLTSSKETWCWKSTASTGSTCSIKTARHESQSFGWKFQQQQQWRLRWYKFLRLTFDIRSESKLVHHSFIVVLLAVQCRIHNENFKMVVRPIVTG